MPGGELAQGETDVAHAVAEALAAVAGHQHQAASGELLGGQGGCARGGIAVEPGGDRLQCVDHGVAGDHDALRRHALAVQVVGRIRRRRVVPGRELAGQAAVHLLGERVVGAAGAQPGLHVPDRNLLVERRQRRRHAGGRIALDQHGGGAVFGEHAAQASEGAAGEVGEILLGPHELEIHLRADGEQSQHLIEQLAVLAGDADQRDQPA